MAYTARELITRSYFLSQIVSRGLQTVSGEQITDGLYLLNSILGFKSTELQLIPYFTRYEFDTVQGTEEYFIEDLVYVDCLTFNIQQQRFPMREMTRDEYFAMGRVDNIQSLPFCYRVERELNGCRIFLYFVPSQVFEMKLSGAFALSDVTLETDLSLIYDRFYIEYLRYALAEYMCSEWGNTFPDESKTKLASIIKKLMQVSPPDMSVNKRSFFNRGRLLDWQTINLSTGYWPS